VFTLLREKCFPLWCVFSVAEAVESLRTGAYEILGAASSLTARVELLIEPLYSIDARDVTLWLEGGPATTAGGGFVTGSISSGQETVLQTQVFL
jgi:hypothetical protein